MPEAYNQDFATYTMTAGETTQNQYTVVALDTSTEDYCVNPAAKSAAVAGVIQDTTLAAGGTGRLQVSGVGKLKAYAAISIGDELVVADSAGRVRTYVPASDGSGVGVIAVALSAATAQDDIISAEFKLKNVYHT